MPPTAKLHPGAKVRCSCINITAICNRPAVPTAGFPVPAANRRSLSDLRRWQAASLHRSDEGHGSGYVSARAFSIQAEDSSFSLRDENLLLTTAERVSKDFRSEN